MHFKYFSTVICKYRRTLLKLLQLITNFLLAWCFSFFVYLRFYFKTSYEDCDRLNLGDDDVKLEIDIIYKESGKVIVTMTTFSLFSP